MEKGSMVGSGGCMVLNEHTCIVHFAWRTAEFYAHESCGKCTPCREGTRWMVQILERILQGKGRMEDIDLLLEICDQIDGRSFCALGDAAAWPVRASIKNFRHDLPVLHPARAQHVRRQPRIAGDVPSQRLPALQPDAV
jgi:NADH dehydrogenase subunit F (EC 1.6.5.3)